MATRAQQFKNQQERSGPKKAPRPKPARRDSPVDTSKKGVSASDRKAGGASTSERNRYAPHLKRASRVLEDSKSGKPSRKSTRKSLDGAKGATSLTRQQLSRLATPKSRAGRR